MSLFIFNTSVICDSLVIVGVTLLSILYVLIHLLLKIILENRLVPILQMRKYDSEKDIPRYTNNILLN